MQGYYHALDGINVQDDIKAWFKDIEFETFQKQRLDKDYQNPLLNVMKKLILSVVNTLDEDKWQDIYYYEPESSAGLPKGLFLTDKNKKVLPETALSDGYRNVVWLMIEIAWRAIMLNPFLNEKVFEATEGIVLIDEIDLHLHPKWQQRIAEVLTQHFPKLQFIITTHSSLVLASVKGAIIELHEDATVSYHENVYGMKYSNVLRLLMAVKERVPEVQAKIEAYFQLINAAKGKSEEAVKIRKELREMLAQDDNVFNEADTLMSLLEI